MAAHHSWNLAPRSLLPELDLKMLSDAQGYLRCLHAHETASLVQIQALRCFHATYDPIIRSFLHAFGVPATDEEDVCQLVWQDLHLKLESFHSNGTQSLFLSWLKTIAHSKATNFHRNGLRHPTKHLDALREAALQSHEADPVEDYEQKCLQTAVQRVLELLRHQVSETSFRVLWLRLMDEHSASEVAAELHLTPRQVRTLFCRAKQRFRGLWGWVARDQDL